MKVYILSQIDCFIFTECIKRSGSPEVFLRKGVLKIFSKFTGEHPCQSVIATLLRSHFGMGVLQ